MLAQLEDARSTILKQQEEARGKSDPAAFVTFRYARQGVALFVLEVVQSLTHRGLLMKAQPVSHSW
jgi:hypothetical protein